jgi:CHASE2 domain-containing sensor protein
VPSVLTLIFSQGRRRATAIASRLPHGMLLSRRLLVLLLIALAAWGVALLPRLVVPDVVGAADEFFYDSYYRTRPTTDRTNGPVVIVTADERSLKAVGEGWGYGWPWPRELWGRIAQYLDAAGARAIVFDIVFHDPSVYNNASGDDDAFAELMKAVKAPVVFGNVIKPDGEWERFAPPIENPTFAAVNLGDVRTYREYPLTSRGKPSLARQATNVDHSDPSFLLHYYGPHRSGDGWTFRYVPAGAVLTAISQPEHAADVGMSPALFKDKIVLLGTTAVAWTSTPG